MRMESSKLKPNVENQQTARLIRGLRAVAAVTVVGAIYLAMVILMVPDLFDRSVAPVTATEPSHSPESTATADSTKL